MSSLRSYNSMVNIWVILGTMLLFMVAKTECKKCAFKAIFNFGDSNTDTGGFWAAFPAQAPPHGMTYFKKPVGRATDGRVVVDFLAQAFNLPFLSPYLKSIGSDYKYGVNFATLASTVRLPQTSLFVTGVSPFSLEIQLRQMQEFKAKVDELPRKGKTNLPSPNIFGKSLYTFYIGQNDFTGNLARLGISGVKEFLPQVVSLISSTIKEIYALGGRTFWVLNLAPIGCYPAFLVELPHNTSDIDQFGCMISYNNAVVDYNNMLKAALAQTRKKLADANVVYVDTHAVLLELFQHPTSHGLKYGTKSCCGYGDGAYNFNQQVFCGNTKQVNGKNVTAKACEDPQNYVSWDGIHATDAANKVTAYAILNGSYFDPPFPLHKYCDIQPIG
ncbi:GDSL esterase/lipase [Capsicum annuum]|uniref:GDSL esterase/lipase n=1 Tax=Capsicum annuum TaxID=4072 RepID=A0A1U8DVJ1_CAPAN|nr:GDSL esterase/lipase At4g01130 [Capsicum annuum]KAF3648289.1 GDSL esterase/lipase [Capsicum annuum]PHT74667.1 GDSL esterase/lipase [Capsicum annuum]